MMKKHSASTNSWKNSELISIILVGVAIHFLLLLTVFDTYFKSPLENGMVSMRATRNPPSKRLVLFVADGLRAQAIFEDSKDHAPFLNEIRRTRGSWGISNTRVPTESRPGHVAILAGIYEDPSAIFRGWKHNPVDFDSVINQSKNAYCFGSPDIVPIFNKDGLGHIQVFTYGGEMQDFGNKNTTILDSWVFEKLETTLEELKRSERFYEGGKIFFLHLLGLDTAGHAFKPASKEYVENLNYVDENVKIVEQLFRNYYKDDLTTFVFTSDHGMTDWGSHGSGSDHETCTPLLVWGSGINNNIRKDVNQIDIAPLIAGVLGINFPTNNLGMVPIEFLNVSNMRKIEIFMNNLLQVLEIFRVKSEKIRKSTWFFKGFNTAFEKNVSELYRIEDFQKFKDESVNVFKEILIGIEYNHSYFMNYVLFSISAGLSIWISYLSSFVFNNKLNSGKNNMLELGDENKSKFLRNFAVFYVISMIITCTAQKFTISFYIYFTFPGLALYFAQFRLKKLNLNFNSIKFDFSRLLYFMLNISFFILGFKWRFFFSLMMISNAFSIFLSSNNTRIEKSLRKIWIIFCLILAVFPLLPLMLTRFNLILFTFGVISWNLFMTYTAMSLNFKFSFQKIIFNVSALVSLLISLEITSNFDIFKTTSWILFIISLVSIFFSKKQLESRTISVIFGLSPFYVLTTMSYELIFLSFYAFLALIWMRIERGIKSRDPFENCRVCLTFISLILIGFFGTGNIASLNSFDPMWVRCFLTVFSPFKMTILIVVKLLIPLLIACVVFKLIVEETGMNLMNTFCTILFISDVMVFYFMYQIKNVGSWLEIGMSLSHFIVVECLTVGIIFLYLIASILTDFKADEVPKLAQV